MRQLIIKVLLSLTLLLIVCMRVGANESTLQIILAAEMPDVTNPQQARYGELKRLIDIERTKVPTTFFLFGGGSIGPSALSKFDRGSHIIDLLNSLEPDAMGVAKREFSYFLDELSLRSYEAAFPIVASNLIDTRSNTVPNGLIDSVLISREPVTLGFISISDERLVDEYLLDNIVVEDKVTKVTILAKQLRDAGADLIMLHYFDYFTDINTLFDNKIIDYAFNSNTRLQSHIVEQYFTDPRILLLHNPGSALVASFNIDANFTLKSVKSIDLNKIPADPFVENQVKAYVHRVNRLLDDNIAYWDDLYSTLRNEVRSKENAFANFVVDTMREFGQADIALINSGSIRGDTTYAKNTQITRRTIATEMPFRPTLVVITVSGQQVLDALENGLAGLPLLKGSFLQVSGMRVEYDSSALVGQQVISVYINDKALNPQQDYLLATTDYLAAGGDGFVSLSTEMRPNRNSVERTILVSDLVQQTLRIRGKLDSKVDNRIVDKVGRP